MANALMLRLMPLTADWSLDHFLNSAQSHVTTWGGLFIGLVGLVLIIYGAIKLFKAITGRTGSAGPEWLKVVLSLLIGGLLLFGGLKTLKNVSSMGNNMVNQMGGSVVPTEIVHSPVAHIK